MEKWRSSLEKMEISRNMNIVQYVKKIYVLNELYTRFKWRERRISKGNENKDKIFYVVRRPPSEVGLFSYVLTNLGMIQYAIDRGYIPVVDMQNYKNTYLENSEIGEKNSWEYYFAQPCGYALNNIAHSKKIILSGLETMSVCGYPGYSIVMDYKVREKWRSLFSKYIRVRPEIMSEAEEIFDKYSTGDKILGVLCRGTDYIQLKPKEHPIQPTVDMMVKKVREFIAKYKCNKIYLATEDEKIYQQFKAEFGDKLWVTNAMRYINIEDQKLSESEEFKRINKLENGKNYLINIILLTKCHYLVAGCVGGTYGALLMKDGKYEEEYIFKLGFYE